MNLKIPLRLGRILVVLALIVALLGSSIPVPARAVGAGVLYNIAANTGVNLALRAIGVGPGNSPDVFNNLVTTIGEAVSSATAPLAQLLITGSSGNFRSFLSADFLSWILSWLFDSGTVSSSGYHTTPPYQLGDMSYSEALSLAQSYQNYIIFHQAGGYDSLYLCTGSLSVGTSYPINLSSSDGVIYKFSINSNTGGLGKWDTGSKYVNLYASRDSLDIISGTPGYSSSEDLTLDSVGNSLDAAPYTDWVGQSVSNDDQAFVPVSVPSLDSSAISAQTQTQAQAGTIPEAVVDDIIAGAEVDPDVVTLSDIFTAIRSLGADVVEAIQAVPAAIAAIFEPPVVYDSEGNVLPAYQISLTDFFPFCLPFDIYDLLSALAADPVAPVFEWTIAVPRWGISHDIEIDLSEWDSIARLFRTFELAAFVLGFALITREKFLRS